MALSSTYSAFKITTMYRAEKKSLQILLSRTEAGPGRTVKQEQEEISRNHVQTFIYLSVESQKSAKTKNLSITHSYELWLKLTFLAVRDCYGQK